MKEKKLEEILGNNGGARSGKSYNKYYTAIGATVAAGNILAYTAYGTSGLIDAISIDLITVGFTLYQRLRDKQDSDRIEHYLKELDDMETKDKIGLISYSDKRTTDSKAKKLGFIAYQLMKKEVGEQPEIEEAEGISSQIISTLEGKGYIKKGVLGTRLTRKGKLMYSAIFNGLDTEQRGVVYFLNKLYRVPEDEIMPMYQLWASVKENKRKK